MKKNLENLSNIDKAMEKASMKTTANMENKDNDNLETKKKLISIPTEWDLLMKNKNKPASVNNYIIMAIKERMEKDGLI
jgi:predicted DNA binding CopG/RHH family protein